jgi:protein-disulfide isomerase
MNVSEKVVNFALLASAACALVVTGLLVQQRFEQKRQNEELRPRQVSGWPELQAGPLVTGDPNGTVTLVEFSDYQCPFCARFALDVLPELKQKFGSQLKVVHRQWPLSNHPHAYAAARAATCAASQQRFEQIHAALFKRQTEIGKAAFVDFAKEAGVKDLEVFAKCAADTVPVASIDYDIRLAERIGALGTPTILVDGWMFFGVTAQQLDSAITAAIQK